MNQQGRITERFKRSLEHSFKKEFDLDLRLEWDLSDHTLKDFSVGGRQLSAQEYEWVRGYCDGYRNALSTETP